MAGKGGNINPEGKGGFGDNPQHRSNGRWSKETSISYWQNYFIRLTEKEFEEWETKDKTMAQKIAMINVKESLKELAHQKELSDRTEGKSMNYTDITSGGEKININPKEWI